MGCSERSLLARAVARGRTPAASLPCSHQRHCELTLTYGNSKRAGISRENKARYQLRVSTELQPPDPASTNPQLQMT